MKGIQFMIAAVLCFTAQSGTASAQDAAIDLPLASHAYVKDYESFKLAAANDPEVLVNKSNGAAPAVKPTPFEPPLITGSKVHQYLGLGTIVLAALTAATAPDSECEANCAAVANQPRQTNGTHAHLAKATVAMAAATIVTGLIVHWDDFKLSDGFTDPDNLHIMLGVTGAALMAYAVNKSKNSAVPVSHAGIAEMGALGMLAAIKITW
ncbi:hypothetical protein GALL_29550 [mine drainage metagenome]|uniref:Uncharacterized protein n=1 Tax=mine drainage metagenome TaxID=410659 RepID=A0A1J5T7Z2_9ZZZZ